MGTREEAERILRIVTKFQDDRDWIINYLARELEIAEINGQTKALKEKLQETNHD